jgi:hypothetical protein
MRTKTTLLLIRMSGIIIPLSMLLYAKTGHVTFIKLAGIASICVGGFLTYAYIRGQVNNDKSPTVSRSSVAMIFCLITLWIAFVIYRGMK